MAPASWVPPSTLGTQGSTVQGVRLRLYGVLMMKVKLCLVNYARPFFHYDITMLKES